jgi:hypothetical protein
LRVAFFTSFADSIADCADRHDLIRIAVQNKR